MKLHWTTATQLMSRRIFMLTTVLYYAITDVLLTNKNNINHFNANQKTKGKSYISLFPMNCKWYKFHGMQLLYTVSHFYCSFKVLLLGLVVGTQQQGKTLQKEKRFGDPSECKQKIQARLSAWMMKVVKPR